MRALEAEVVDAVKQRRNRCSRDRQASDGLSPPAGAGQAVPLGMLIRLTTGSSWVDIEAILDHRSRT